MYTISLSQCKHSLHALADAVYVAGRPQGQVAEDYCNLVMNALAET